MMRDPYDPYGGHQTEPDLPMTAQDLDNRTPEQQRADAIRNCPLCNEHGYRMGSTLCDHFDYGPAAKRGVEACKAALRKGDRT
ncbi:hypothetical protein [Mycolicibacterium sp. A43C]